MTPFPTSDLATFAGVTLVSLGASTVLVSRLERVGARLGMTEALVGLMAALAADGPEITSACTAMARGQRTVGVGVVLGSNVFNLAAMLGLGALTTGRIRLHRSVVLLDGALALAIAAVCLMTTSGVAAPGVGLLVGVAVMVPYVLVVGLPHRWLGDGGAGRSFARYGQHDTGRVPGRMAAAGRTFQRVVGRAIRQEEEDLHLALSPTPGRWVDAAMAALALGVVIVASVVMERSATEVGGHFGWPPIVIGGLVLAAVTSLPNAVAGVYLARRGRGAATLSVAANSNTLNVLMGLLVPAAIVGVASSGPGATSGALVAWWYAITTLVVVLVAYRRHGLGRVTGALLVLGYLAFAGVLLVS